MSICKVNHISFTELSANDKVQGTLNHSLFSQIFAANHPKSMVQEPLVRSIKVNKFLEPRLHNDNMKGRNGNVSNRTQYVDKNLVFHLNWHHNDLANARLSARG